VSDAPVTLGIDLSSNDGKTAACAIRWEAGTGIIETPRRKLTTTSCAS
jgi:hypothetical protein